MLRKRIEPRTPALLLCVTVIACLWLATILKAQAPAPARQSALAAATRQISRGNLEAADQTLLSLLSSNPDDEQALTLLGDLRSRQGRYLEAESLFRRVLQINPKSVAGYRKLAAALVAQDKTDEATAMYQKAEAEAPQDIGIKVELARLRVAQGKFSEALSDLDAIPAADFPSVALPVKAASLVGAGRAGEAVALIPRAKGSPAVAMELAEVFLAAKLPDQALRVLDVAGPALVNPSGMQSAAVTRASVRFECLRGRALQAKGDHASALAAFQRALRLDPNSVDAMLGISELYAAEKKNADALAMVQRARVASHDSAPVLRRYVVMAMNADQRAAAVQVLPELLEKGGQAPDDQYLAAAVMLADGQYSEAGQLLEKYVSHRPQDAKGLMGLGMAYLNEQRYADARTMLERSLQLDPGLAEAEYQLGLVATKEGKRDEAVRNLERAVQEQPGHAKALFALGNIYLEAGELDKALAALQRSAAADPTDSKTEYDLGLVLKKMGRTEEAKQHLERFRQMEAAHEARSGRLGVKPQSR